MDSDLNITIVHIKKNYNMNKTVRFLVHINKNKKNKATYLNWKTFNAKQTWIHVPKVLALLDKISNTVQKAINVQTQNQYDYITALAQATNSLYLTNNYNGTYALKQSAYASVFTCESTEKNNINGISINNKKRQELNIVMQYINYIFLVNMYNNIKKTKNNIVTLPRKRTSYTILKSPHADKKAREQFMKELYNVRISIKNHVATMQYVNKMLIAYTKAFIHSYKYTAFYENKI